MQLMNINEAQHENKILLKRYRNLLRKVRSRENRTKDITKAFRFALEAHKDMRRRSGEPFIYHPLEVAYIVSEEIGLGSTSIIAALLHDIVEDTEYEIQDIADRFGDEIAKIVNGLTKIKATKKVISNSELEIKNFRKLLLTISKDARVALIKIADRLHNMRTLESMPTYRQLKIKAETQYVYAPLAYRLGLHAIKSELENLSLKYSDPQIYQEITSKLKQSRSKKSDL